MPDISFQMSDADQVGDLMIMPKPKALALGKRQKHSSLGEALYDIRCQRAEDSKF